MNANDLFKAIAELDLSPIKFKLTHVASGAGWSREKADAVEKEYRRFLCLMKLYPDEDIAPSMDVDTFWHYHILDTMKYAADCEQVFGYFLHHYPYVGMHGGDDEQFRIDSGERMATLYQATFGEGAISATAYCAGPRIEKLASIDATAYCAGPRDKVAYCAGPRIGKLASIGEGTISATAYCAGPRIRPTFHASLAAN